MNPGRGLLLSLLAALLAVVGSAQAVSTPTGLAAKTAVGPSTPLASALVRPDPLRIGITPRLAAHRYDQIAVATGVAAKDAGRVVVRGGSPEAFDIAPRVFGQLENPRLGGLAGRLGPDDLQRLANAPSASRYLDARTGNINVIQNVQGVTLRITTPRDAMRIISVGPIRARQVTNRVAAGDFIPLP